MAEALTVQKLASLALASPQQREVLQREIRTMERALQSKAMPFETLSAQEVGLSEREWGKQQQDLRQTLQGEMTTAGMDLFTQGSRESGVPVPDAQILRDQLARNEQTLRMASAPELSGHQKNQLWRMAKELRDVIRRGMPSYEQLERATHENIEVFTRHQERTMPAQLALRNIIRMLDPGDETVVIETLRPHEPSRVNWDEWFGNFDQLYFTEEHERERLVQTLDDDTYARYMRLRLKGVETPKLIMRTMGITQGVFEACKVRLDRELALLDTMPEEDGATPVPVPMPAASQVTTQRPRSPAKRPHRSKAALAARAARPAPVEEQPQGMTAFAAVS